MPQDLVVRESRGLHILLALFCVGLLGLLLPDAVKVMADGELAGVEMLLLGFTAFMACGLPLCVKSAWQRKVVLVAFERGLFWPALHPEVIPWSCVESVALSHIGKGTSVYVVFTADFQRKLRMPWLSRFFFIFEKMVGMTGRLFKVLHDHTNKAVVHAIDDWIRYETRRAPKARYRPGIADAVMRFLR